MRRFLRVSTMLLVAILAALWIVSYLQPFVVTKSYSSSSDTIRCCRGVITYGHYPWVNAAFSIERFVPYVSHHFVAPGWNPRYGYWEIPGTDHGFDIPIWFVTALGLALAIFVWRKTPRTSANAFPVLTGEVGR